MASVEPIEVLIQVMSWLSAVCFMLMLSPQIYLNYQRKSTEGLSLGLVILWHISALLIYPYLMHMEEALAIQLQWAIFNVASIVTELQFTRYRERSKADHLLLMPGLALLHVIGNVAVIVSLYYLFEFLAGKGIFWLVDLIGSVGGSVALAVGFFPQLWTMCRTKTSDGFSLGVTFFDMTGSTLSIAVMLLQHRHALNEVQPGSIGPYGVIIALQLTLLFTATVLFPSSRPSLCGSLVKRMAGPFGTRSPRASSCSDSTSLTSSPPSNDKAAAMELPVNMADRV